MATFINLSLLKLTFLQITSRMICVFYEIPKWPLNIGKLRIIIIYLFIKMSTN